MEVRNSLTELRPLQVQQSGQQKRQRVYGKQCRTRPANNLFYNPLDHSNKVNSIDEQVSEVLLKLNLETISHVDAKASAVRTASSPDATEEWTLPLRKQTRQRHIAVFDSLVDRLCRAHHVNKIGEGSFADVFLLRSEVESFVFKVMPLKPPGALSDGTVVSEASREVRLSALLGSFGGFPAFRGAKVVRGSYPETFLSAFRKESRRTTTINQDPSERFSHNQVFAILELENVGEDMECIKKPSAFAVFDIFWQLVIAIANAEATAEFEHRDLHISNVCISEWISGRGTDLLPCEASKSCDKTVTRAGMSNSRPTVIDFTNSRARLSNGRVTYNKEVTWSGSIEGGRGREEKMQCAAYARMQECIEEAYVRSDVQHSSKYSVFAPRTNTVWLVLLLRQLFLRGKRRVVDGGSDTCTKMQEEIWAVLADIIDRYKTCRPHFLPEGAEGLLQVGLAKGWITMQEIDFFKERFASV